jgi:hypothetical protein
MPQHGPDWTIAVDDAMCERWPLAQLVIRDIGVLGGRGLALCALLGQRPDLPAA